MTFLSSAPTDREEHWSTYEQEAVDAFQAFPKLDYLLACDSSTRAFTNHRSIFLILNPVAMELFLCRQKVLKVVRWSLYFSVFNYLIKHVPGFSKAWPDTMTRWIRGYRKGLAIRRTAPAIPFSGATQSPETTGFR